MKLPKLVDMSIDKEAPMTNGVPFALGEMQDKYPCGLEITLGNAELEKLGLTDDCEVGELLHLFCMAKVVGVRKHDTERGQDNSVHLQICFMGTECEDDEDEKEEKPKNKAKGKRSLYF
jgi:hypothetical protein